jgi:hypothetical protein
MKAGFFAALTCIAVAFAGPSPAATIQRDPIPANRQLAFRVQMDGEDIGRHVVNFETKEDGLGVEVRIDFLVRFFGIPVYRYNHVNREVWSKDGKLLALESQTNDDGTPERARIQRLGDRLAIDGSMNKAAVPGGLLSSSYWNPDLVHQTKLIDSRNGQIFNISVTPNGEDPVEVDGRLTQAKRYDIRGDLELSVWYAPNGEWVKMAFDHKGRHFDYQRVRGEALSAANP